MARQKRSELPFWATKEGREAANKPARFVAYYQSYGHQCSLELVCNTEQEVNDFLVNVWGVDPSTVTLHKVM